MKKILEKRLKSQKILSLHIKTFLYRKKVIGLIKKLKLYYTIIPSIQTSEEIKITIIFSNSQKRTFPLYFCPIRKQYLIDIDRYLIKKLKYKFYFIMDGIKLVDTKYKIIYQLGNYYNIINFKDIQDNEYKLEKVYDKEIENYYNSLLSDSESNITNVSSRDDLTEKKIASSHCSSLINGLTKYNEQFVSTSSVKSILKERKFYREKSFKKVSFGKVEYHSAH